MNRDICYVCDGLGFSINEDGDIATTAQDCAPCKGTGLSIRPTPILSLSPYEGISPEYAMWN
jgi:DnaJ-class molecular chaperone